MADPRIKQINIKTGVVKRLSKEKTSYEVESVQIEVKIEKMRTDGKDEYDIKKQGEVLQETRAMVPDCQRRLKKAYGDLEALLEKESDLSEAKEYITALTIMEEAKTKF